MQELSTSCCTSPSCLHFPPEPRPLINLQNKLLNPSLISLWATGKSVTLVFLYHACRNTLSTLNSKDTASKQKGEQIPLHRELNLLRCVLPGTNQKRKNEIKVVYLKNVVIFERFWHILYIKKFLNTFHIKTEQCIKGNYKTNHCFLMNSAKEKWSKLHNVLYRYMKWCCTGTNLNIFFSFPVVSRICL